MVLVVDTQPKIQRVDHIGRKIFGCTEIEPRSIKLIHEGDILISDRILKKTQLCSCRQYMVSGKIKRFMISSIDIETVLFVLDQTLTFCYKTQTYSKCITACCFKRYFGPNIDIPPTHGKGLIDGSHPLTPEQKTSFELTVVQSCKGRT